MNPTIEFCVKLIAVLFIMLGVVLGTAITCVALLIRSERRFKRKAQANIEKRKSDLAYIDSLIDGLIESPSE